MACSSKTQLANITQQRHHASEETSTVAAVDYPMIVGQRQRQHFTRLEIHTTKKIKARIAQKAIARIMIKVLKLASIQVITSSKALLGIWVLPPPDPPPSEHCARNAQNPSANHFLNSKGLNKMRTMWFHAGVIGSITEIFLCFSICSYFSTSRNGAGVI